MWADETLFIKAWESMLADTIQSRVRRLSVFVSDSNVDSVACARIIANLLFHYSITYSIRIVNGWNDLHAKLREEFIDEVTDTKFPRSVLLLNCGGKKDISKFKEVPFGVRFYVIDAHRPIHHKNLSSFNTSVVVFMPNEINGVTKEFIKNMISLESKKSLETRKKSDGIVKKSFYSNISKPNSKTNLLRKRLIYKNKIKNQKNDTKIVTVDHYELLSNEYYGIGSYWGTPASYVAYKIAYNLNKSRFEDIWYAIVSNTEFYLKHMISLEAYNKINYEFMKQLSDSVNSEIDDEYQGTDGQFYKSAMYGKIESIKDFRIPLFRYWTLYDAVMNSLYIAARLRTWRDSGIGTAELWLAKMGFTPNYSRQNWIDLPPEIKASLPNAIKQWSGEFNLMDIEFSSFVISYSYKKIAAADVVYSVTAILEFDSNSKIRSDSSLIDKVVSGANSCKFWTAWKTLDPKSVDYFERGVQIAKKLHQFIILQVGLALNRRDIRSLGKIRVYDMSLMVFKKNVFCIENNPGVLSRLVAFFQDYCMQQNGKSRPCIVIGPQDNLVNI
jgi:cell division control protein 45